MVAREVLPNGMIVLVDERPGADTLAFQLNARAGSRDDGPAPGITALTSRLMFQGTRRRPSEADLQRAAAAVGGSVSRGTGIELSDFLALLPAGEAGLGFDLLADLVVEPLLADDAFARQVQIATQELSRQRSDPGSLLGDLYQSHVFAGHPLAAPLLGTAESLAALSPEALRDHPVSYTHLTLPPTAAAARCRSASDGRRRVPWNIRREVSAVIPGAGPSSREPAQALSWKASVSAPGRSSTSTIRPLGRTSRATIRHRLL